MRGKVVDPLIDAVRSNNVAAIKKLVAGGHPINKLDEDKRTALHIALSRPLSSSSSSQSSASRLDEKSQALHAAAIKQQEEVVRTLVKLGADPSLRDRNGWTPLHAAAQFAPFGLVLYFVEECCRDVNEINKDGTTALHYLARRQVSEGDREGEREGLERERESERGMYVDVLMAMAAKGADVNAVTYIGEAPLHQAALKGNTLAAEFLLSFGADLHILSKRGDTPLHYAVMSGHVPIARYLLSMGADVSMLSALGPIEALAPSDEMRALLGSHVSAGERRCGSRGGKESGRSVTVCVLKGENILFLDTICVVKYGGECKKTDVPRSSESRQTITWDFDLDFSFHPHVASILVYVTRKNKPMGMAVVDFDGALRNEADGWYDVTSTLLGSEEKTTLYRIKIAVTLRDDTAPQESGVASPVVLSPRLKEESDSTQIWKITPKHSSGMERNMSLGVVGRTLPAKEKEREKEKERDTVEMMGKEEERRKEDRGADDGATKESDSKTEGTFGENEGRRTPPLSPSSPRPPVVDIDRANKAASQRLISTQKTGSGFRVLRRETKLTMSGSNSAVPPARPISPRTLSRCNTDIVDSASAPKIAAANPFASSAVSLSSVSSSSSSSSSKTNSSASSLASAHSSPLANSVSSPSTSVSSSPHSSSSSSLLSNSLPSSTSSLIGNTKPSESSPSPSLSSPSPAESSKYIHKDSTNGTPLVHVSRVGSLRIDPKMVRSAPIPPPSPTSFATSSPTPLSPRSPSPSSSSSSLSPSPLSSTPLPPSFHRRPLPPIPSRPVIFTPRMSIHLKSHSGVTVDRENDIYIRVEDDEGAEGLVIGEEGKWVDDVAEGGGEREGEGEEKEERGESNDGSSALSSENTTPTSPLPSTSPTPSPSPASAQTTDLHKDEEEQWKKSKVTADDLRKYLQDASQSTPVRWEIERDELTIMQKIAEGTSGKVLRGAYRYQDVAVKILKKKMDARQAQDFVEEFSILATLRSPFVVYFYGICLEPDMALVMEYCSNGSVYEVLNRKNLVFDWALFMRMAEDMCRGLLSLHSWVPQIVHRDVKSLNFLVDANWVTKVSDFGLSRHSSQSNRDTLGKVRGTFAYSPPEVYTGEPHTAKSDVYSLSIVLWELVHRIVTGKYSAPYKEYDFITFDFQILLQSTKGLRPTIPPQCPENVKNVITMCWHSNPEFRPESRELLFVVQALRKEFMDEKRLWQSLVKDLSDVPHTLTDASLPTMIANRGRDVLVAETVQDSSTGQAVVTIKKGVNATTQGVTARKEGEVMAMGAPPKSKGGKTKTSPTRSILSPPKGLKPVIPVQNTSNDSLPVDRKGTLHGVTSVTSMSALASASLNSLANSNASFDLSIDGNVAKEEVGAAVDKKRVRRSISAKTTTSRFRPPSVLRSREAKQVHWMREMERSGYRDLILMSERT